MLINSHRKVIKGSFFTEEKTQHNQKEIKNLLEKRWFAIFKTRPKFWQWWSTQVKNFLQLKQFNSNVNNNIQLQDNFKLIFIFIPIRSVNASVWKIQYHLITSYPKANMQSKNRQKAWLACSCRSVAHGLKKNRMEDIGATVPSIVENCN